MKLMLCRHYWIELNLILKETMFMEFKLCKCFLLCYQWSIILSLTQLWSKKMFCIYLYWVNTKTISRYTFSLAVNFNSNKILVQSSCIQTHPLTTPHQGPTKKEHETHFSLVNTKSWMCDSVLSSVQHIASANTVYITLVYPPAWVK